MRWKASRRPAPALAAAIALAAAACAGAPAHTGDAAGTSATTASSTTSTTTTIPPTTAPPTTRPLRSFTLAGAGDILLHNYVIVEGRENAGGNGYNFDPMFDEVRDRISAADFAICHQETPISADNTALTVPRTKIFNAPHEIATALKNAGFDACDTASNHTWDRGAAGVQQTLDVLDANGLGHAGAARSPEEAATPRIYDVKGVKLAHLAFTYTIHNSGGPTTTVPPEMPWLREMLWPAIGVEGVLAQARRARELGAEFVVLSMHWGAEYQTVPTAQQRELAQQLLASPDVDLILGDHVHVVQPCEQIGGKFVLYGMGNFLSNQSPAQDASLRVETEEGTLNTFTVQETSPGTFQTAAYQLTPTRVMIPTHRIVPSTPDRFPAAYDRTVSTVNLLNQAAPGACAVTPAF
jgi:poly-gamma-glutamate capsule biosynthesis protein CapA/YwtB (metallophosphatase superfamily)